MWLHRQLTLGSRYLDDQLAHLYSGVVGALVNPWVVLFYRFVQRERSLRRVRTQMDIFLEATDAVEAGASSEAVLEQHSERLFRTEEIYNRCRTDHPDFPKAAALIRESHRARLASLVRMLRADGASFEEMMRGAFTRQEAEELWNIQYRVLEQLLALLEDGDLLKVPGVIRKEVFLTLRGIYEWYRRWMGEEMDRIYGPPGGTAPPLRAESAGAA